MTRAEPDSYRRHRAKSPRLNTDSIAPGQGPWSPRHHCHRPSRAGPAHERDSPLPPETRTTSPPRARPQRPPARVHYLCRWGQVRRRLGSRARAGDRATSSRPHPPRALGDRCKLEAVTRQSSGRTTQIEADGKRSRCLYMRYTAPNIASRSAPNIATNLSYHLANGVQCLTS